LNEKGSYSADFLEEKHCQLKKESNNSYKAIVGFKYA